MSKPRLVFRKRVKLFGPLHLNVSLHSVGLGVSVPGASVSINNHGRRQVSAGIPGSGIRVQQVWSGKASSRPTLPGSTPRMSLWPVVMALVMLALLLLVAAMR